jgi:hypothetical protein
MTWHYNDLVGPMVAHTVYDFIALLYLSRTAQDFDRNSPDSS